MNISGRHFLDLADLLSANLHTGENELQQFWDGKLVVSEVLNILNHGFVPLSSWPVGGPVTL